ncbi:MAG: hypothetical protein A2854_03650 [Parcubacteria group bacterium RIFCSPHIGHO2_01_FULL_56_18]|nr:MAG: hypothetical protein A2854_03650 [Parcubacteria group bacterium RIFCSPHIGHO2_01_FULL_56_18]
MRAREIYERYQVPPWLQLHQVRVAAVGKLLAESLTDPVDTHLIVMTCLVHDIGAIVKFDFSPSVLAALDDVCPPEDVPHWIAVQEEMHARYGTREYPATDAIIGELDLEKVRHTFRDMGLSNLPRVLTEGSREARIAQYADLRVGPHSVLPLLQRIADITERYRTRWNAEGRAEEAAHYPSLSRELEQQLFQDSHITPEDLNDLSIRPVVDALWEYEVA